MRRETRQAKRRRTSACKGWVLTGRELHVALALFVLVGAAEEPLLLYVKTVARKHHWPSKADGDVIYVVTTLYLAADLQYLFALVDEEAVGHRSLGGSIQTMQRMVGRSMRESGKPQRQCAEHCFGFRCIGKDQI